MFTFWPESIILTFRFLEKLRCYIIHDDHLYLLIVFMRLFNIGFYFHYSFSLLSSLSYIHVFARCIDLTIFVYFVWKTYFYFYPQGDQLRDLTTKSLVNSATMEHIRIISEASKTLSTNIGRTRLSPCNCNIAVVFMNLFVVFFYLSVKHKLTSAPKQATPWNTRLLIIHSFILDLVRSKFPPRAYCDDRVSYLRNFWLYCFLRWIFRFYSCPCRHNFEWKKWSFH